MMAVVVAVLVAVPVVAQIQLLMSVPITRPKISPYEMTRVLTRAEFASFMADGRL